MTRSVSYRRRALGFAAASSLVLALSSAAHAFTFESAQGVTGGQALVDPDSRFNMQGNNGTGNGQTTIRQGNTTLQFGSRGSANQNFNPNNLFDPFYRDGR